MRKLYENVYNFYPQTCKPPADSLVYKYLLDILLVELGTASSSQHLYITIPSISDIWKGKHFQVVFNQKQSFVASLEIIKAIVPPNLLDRCPAMVGPLVAFLSDRFYPSKQNTWRLASTPHLIHHSCIQTYRQMIHLSLYRTPPNICPLSYGGLQCNGYKRYKCTFVNV